MKKSSCLGLFLKTFVLGTLLLGVLTALGVVVAIQFFEIDAELWKDVSRWNSYPFVAGGIVVLVSALLSVLISVFLMVLQSLLARTEGGDPRLRPARKKRPQSKRNTTV